MSGKRGIAVLLTMLLLLSGCAPRSVDQLYCLPRRSEDYNHLQSAIDGAMGGLEYCAPRAGENQQTVQMADLDGDGEPEYLLFARGNSENPLKILIFCKTDADYVLAGTIESAGTAFDMVEYVPMDDVPGYELIVGRQLSDQLVRSVSVYRFSRGAAEQIITDSYVRFVTCDLNSDGKDELLLLQPGESDASNGTAVLYDVRGMEAERSQQVGMSESITQLKRVIPGMLHGKIPAVFVASAVGESAVITDVFAFANRRLANVTFSNESGTSVHTLRNYYVYADDIDEDGVVELPDLITMHAPDGAQPVGSQYLIRWYAMTLQGNEVDKLFTYHNFPGGWYLSLDRGWAERVSVSQEGGRYSFYIWDETFTEAQKIMTVYALTGKNREEQALRDNRFVLYRDDTTTYAANLEIASAAFGISRESLVQSFHLIHKDWKTGET